MKWKSVAKQASQRSDRARFHDKGLELNAGVFLCRAVLMCRSEPSNHTTACTKTFWGRLIKAMPTRSRVNCRVIRLLGKKAIWFRIRPNLQEVKQTRCAFSCAAFFFCRCKSTDAQCETEPNQMTNKPKELVMIWLGLDIQSKSVQNHVHLPYDWKVCFLCYKETFFHHPHISVSRVQSLCNKNLLVSKKPDQILGGIGGIFVVWISLSLWTSVQA